MDELLEDVDGGVRVKDVPLVRQGYLSWKPER